MNTDKKTPCFLSVFICVHPWLIRFAFCGVVAQLDSLAHPNCEDDFRSPEAEACPTQSYALTVTACCLVAAGRLCGGFFFGE